MNNLINLKTMQNKPFKSLKKITWLTLKTFTVYNTFLVYFHFPRVLWWFVINNNVQELIAAWDTEERVKALKLAIQCAKLLADVTVIKFYPSKFVLVTEILDTFGKLVYERIKKRSQVPPDTAGKTRSASEKATLQEHLNDQAKETCRNWFYKIASIRELLPRLVY